MELLRKENLLIAVALVCVVIYCNQKMVQENQLAQDAVK